ncbi:MAG: DUF3050 domain-containing protein [Pirellulales bacterium]
MSSFKTDPELQALRSQLCAHPLYHALQSPEDVARFQELHVFCVWDFMSLLKALQRRLTCIDVPWQPAADPAACRLINEIVLGEESDEDGQGGHASHFELYLASMRDSGANTRPIERLLAVVRRGGTLETALTAAETPPAIANFVRNTLRLAETAPLHQLAAAFGLGREDIIPDLFVRLLERLAQAEPERFRRFQYYLERHVELDGDSHGPSAHRLIARLCGDDPTRQREALATAKECLADRLRVWDAILASLRTT